MWMFVSGFAASMFSGLFGIITCRRNSIPPDGCVLLLHMKRPRFLLIGRRTQGWPTFWTLWAGLLPTSLCEDLFLALRKYTCRRGAAGSHGASVFSALGGITRFWSGRTTSYSHQQRRQPRAERSDSPHPPNTCYYLFVFIPVLHKVAANKVFTYLTFRKL